MSKTKQSQPWLLFGWKTIKKVSPAAAVERRLLHMENSKYRDVDEKLTAITSLSRFWVRDTQESDFMQQTGILQITGYSTLLTITFAQSGSVLQKLQCWIKTREDRTSIPNSTLKILSDWPRVTLLCATCFLRELQRKCEIKTVWERVESPESIQILL